MNITKINNHTLYRWNMQKSILILLFTLMANYIYAEKVSEQDASDVAVNFFKSETGLTSPKAILYYTQTEADGSIDFYIFNFVAVKGFVMVTADDNLEPVIAYSTESDFNLNGVEQTGVSDWIHDVRKQITAVVKQNLKADTRISDLWLAYKSGAGIIQPTAAAVLPLLTTIWNQESMISGVSHFNSLCPYNNFRNARSVTGCVATAMAQIMRYWKQPSAGTGSNSYNCVNSLSGYIYGTQSVNFGTTNYDWANMPDTVTATTSNAIDILMYHCGVAVEMDYGVNILPEKGSSSMTTGGSPSAQAAYVDYFGYRNTLQDVDASDYTTADWRTLLINELNAKRPIHYRGQDPANGGHSWVCDGYNASSLFHMNWGWGGSNNGYYNITNLNPGAFNFSTDQAAIIGIWPGSLSDCNANWNLTIPQFFDATWQASDYITSNAMLSNNARVTYTAAREIILTDGFYTNPNVNFTAKIQPCITYRIGNDGSGETNEETNESSPLVYPNPANNFITVKINNADSKADFKVYNNTLQLVKTITAENGIENKISTVDLAPGIYFLIVTIEDETYQQKFVIAR